MTTETMRNLQGVAFLAVSLSSLAVALSILAQRARETAHAYIVPAGIMGALRSLAIAVLTGHMAAGRFEWLPWAFVSLEATVVYVSCAAVMLVVQVAWWFKK